MATGTLSLAPDLADSWLFRQLRPVIEPKVRAKSAPLAAVAEEAVEAEQPLLSLEQQVQILSHAAREFGRDYDLVIGRLNNIHGRHFDDLSEAFGQRIDALATALEAADVESARAAANRLSLVVYELQANVPAWDFVRGLQRLVERCSQLGR